MAEKPPRRLKDTGSSALFTFHGRKRHPHLFLQKQLEDEANQFMVEKAELERVAAVLSKWADAAYEGHLAHKETELDAEFMQVIFGNALNYKSISESPNDYHREKNPTIAGAGIADAALGLFISGQQATPTVVVELKGADTDLDHDKPGGRTPVQQCWDYLNNLPDTSWGIVSNYVTIRLYHKAATQRAYEEFTVADFRDPSRIRPFYYIFEKTGLVGNKVANALGPTRATLLLRKTQNQQKEVGDKLYKYYADSRQQLIGELIDRKGFTQDAAIRVAQKLLDRIIFMAFCEDRGLLPDKLIESTWKNVAPLARATNPRWQNFLDAFHAIDKGHPSLDLTTGYNGGLFKNDDTIDNLNLDDQWTDVFHEIGKYDFREGGEVTVDVLGHIFERSITELEKMRVVGLFGSQAEKALAAMPKSAERKRFGIYYTPPQFTRLIVDETVGKLIGERVESLPDDHAGLKNRIAALRKLKIVDPACGSGAFLIAAYERLEDAYEEVARALRVTGHIQEALNLTNEYPDHILFENLCGVDLSAESVEITQLALWIRSARKGRPLTDLSNNIRRGNSLIHDPSVYPDALDWHAAFPKVFAAGGFDAVIGNPPWEKLSVKKREFFSAIPDLIADSNASVVRAKIEKLLLDDPALSLRWSAASESALRQLEYVRKGDRYPLAGRGDVNTYSLFAELSRQLVSPTGRVGLLVPSGIATDATTQQFFADLIESKTLTALYDFENKRGWFEDVHRAFKFSVLLMNGRDVAHESARFVFFAHTIEDLSDRQRQITLSPKDLKLLNPNTLTSPIFRTRVDAELTKHLYRRVPVLIDKSRREGGNPWGARLTTMFHQSADSGGFIKAEQLRSSGLKLRGNIWEGGDGPYLPAYEAKMIQQYDHRAAHAIDQPGNWLRRGQAEQVSLVDHQNPEFVVLPRWWCSRSVIAEQLGGGEALPAILSFRKVTSPTNHRTMLAAFIPFAGVIDSQQLILFGESQLSWRRRACLLGNLNSLPFDFITRQKVGGVNLNFFIVEQIPTLPPDAYDEKCPWDKKTTLEDWIAERVLKLTCTANDMRPLAKAADFKPGAWKWKEAERDQLRAELDAAYFHLYGLSREDVEYVLGTFQGIKDEDEKHGGIGQTHQLVMEAFDGMP
jgi:hypothetical protein